MRRLKIGVLAVAAAAFAAFAISADAIEPMPPIPEDLLEQIHNQPRDECEPVSDTLARQDFWRAYPQRALEGGIQGWVVMRVVVATDGRVTSVTPVQAAPAGVFEDASAHVVARVRFPALPVECTRLTLIQFRQAQ